MRVDLFDFDLPERLIALRPEPDRAQARLLVVRPGYNPELQDSRIGDLPSLLRRGDVLVVNDTRVIPARLAGRRTRGESSAAIEVTLVERLAPSSWRAFARPGKRLRAGDRIAFGEALAATVLGKDEAAVDLGFDRSGEALDRAVEAVGTMPLPPYIAGRRAPDESDRADYQTMFARASGAVAAPTASLHFTPALVDRLDAAGVSVERVTLHVGAGTFLPVKAADTADHVMHSEWARLDAETAARLNAARERGGRIVAVGTTPLRVLESAAASGQLGPFEGATDIFITPGYRFRAVDVLLTNFHLPRSTLVMLVAAFVGHEVQQGAYRHAIEHGYRFYSYGDAGLLFRSGGG